jgi:hypothetical protein
MIADVIEGKIRLNLALLGCAFFRGFFSWIDSAGRRSSSEDIFHPGSRTPAG